MVEATITPECVKERIDDWENRINVLFKNIQEWAAELSDWKPEEGRVTQRNEHLMQKKGVSPRKLPTLNFYNKKRRVSFVPSALWIVGANGRINIITNSRLYILVDRSGEYGASSNWQYTTPDMRPNTEEFNRETFLKILDQN